MEGGGQSDTAERHVWDRKRWAKQNQTKWRDLFNNTEYRLPRADSFNSEVLDFDPQNFGASSNKSVKITEILPFDSFG